MIESTNHRIVEAEEDNLVKAVGLNRHDLDSLTGLAHFYYKTRRFNQAYELFQEAVSLDSGNLSLWFYFGRCCERLDKRVESMDAYRRCSAAGGGWESRAEERIAALGQGLAGVVSQGRSQKILAPRRILVLNNLYPPQELGGYGRLMCDFANILEKRGHKVYVLTSDTPHLGCIDKDEPNIDRGLVLCGGWENGVSKLINDNNKILRIIKGNSEKVRNVIRAFCPELCLVGNIDFLSCMVFQPLLEKGIPVIHHVGNESPGYTVSDTPRSSLYRLATASRWVRDEILGKGYPLTKISVIYPGALVKEFKMHILPAQDKLRIAYASIMLPYKGPQILLEALNRLHDRGVPFHCSLAGSVTNERFVDELRNFIAVAGMEDKVELLGFLPRKRLKGFFARHNVLAFPSVFQEPFGISQVEAMAAGLTVVSSGTGGTREIVEHGVSGLVFESENGESLASELSGLTENPEKWRELARTGQRLALEEFDIEKSVDLLEQEFSALIDCRRLLSAEHGQSRAGKDVLGNYNGFERVDQGESVKSQMHPKDELLKALAKIILKISGSLSFTILEIGALRIEDKTEPFHQLLDCFPGSKIIAFEVDEKICEELNNKTKQNIKYFPVPLGRKEETCLFYETVHPMCSSLYKPNEELMNQYNNMMEAAALKSVQYINTEGLDFFTKNNNIEDVDFIKIDIQGAELDVFKGGVHTLADAVAIVSEVEFIPHYINQPLFGDVCAFLSEHEFMFHKFLGLCGRSLKPIVLNNNPNVGSQHIWSDAMFVKDILKTDKLSSDQLLKMGILTFIYDSPDILFYCARKYDERSGTNIYQELLNLMI